MTARFLMFRLAAFAPDIYVSAVFVSGATEGESCLAVRRGAWDVREAFGESRRKAG